MNPELVIAEAKRLKEWIIKQGEDDPDLVHDMIEGETDLFALREWAAKKFLDEKAFLSAIKERMGNLSDRKSAAERRMEKMRLVLIDCMNASGEKSWRGPEATISLTVQKPKPVISDESLIPDKFWNVKREINKSAINEAFKDGEQVPGTSLDNGGQSITIRSK